MVEKRTDPEDGRAYTFEELAGFYKGKYSKKEIQAYWQDTCTSKAGGYAQAKADSGRKSPGPKSQNSTASTTKSKSSLASKSTAAMGDSPSDRSPAAGGDSTSAAAAPVKPAKPALRRSRSWLPKVCGLALLPCEEQLGPLIEQHEAQAQAGDEEGMEATQMKLLEEHPFVNIQTKDCLDGALAAGVKCKAVNFKMNVGKFKRWLKLPEGKPFEEKGKGYDDGCYLTSALLRAFMPRGYTVFEFTKEGAEKASTVSVVLRGFLKFTGLTAADEDEESHATEETDAFMFRGFTRADASRFAVTTKSNGENGKYTVRKVFDEWYCFGGSKNTGMVWRLGNDVGKLYPIPKHDNIAAIGPQIVDHVNKIFTERSASNKAFLEAIHADCMSIMVELNDPTHEHIFPIHESRLEHVAILSRRGYPLPQKDAYKFFDTYKLYRVECQVHENMKELEAVMDKIRKSTEIEGAVVYLEKVDDTPVGLVKIKSDHYVIARRTREVMRSTLIHAIHVKRDAIADAVAKTSKRLRTGMKELTHVGGCSENHEAWAAHAVAFAEAWATAYKNSDERTRKALVNEFHNRYGSLYFRFWSQKAIMPLLSSADDDVAGEDDAEQPDQQDSEEEGTDAKSKKGRKGRKKK
eukprot:TRINITY_DN11931_c0_g1_i1.p1 TRINITY_DN11931_c0_g1~~TRINITY_DN11931_c0_g1_i1.p1  ORF type:complete len:634 (-),score=132.44 TRINITY_DN11931_c0_g1_i1:435-2336(-)